MKAGITIESWKAPIFERHLTQAGYEFTNKGELTQGVLLLDRRDDELRSARRGAEGRADRGEKDRGATVRNMSFALTVDQILEESKDVTRRLGWLHLKRGDQLRPVRKCMGLRPGEQLDVLRDPILVIDVRRERLDRMLTDIEYGFEEVRREGFANHPTYCWPSTWVEMFCATHKGCTPATVITRIVFAYRAES